MIKFTNLSLRNFLSYGNNVTTVDLDREGTTLIVGEDLDNTTNGKGANGVGKSTIINAVCYALYDKPISNISKDNLINNINKKSTMEVSLEFEVRGVKYLIKRSRTKKNTGAAQATVSLFEDGKDITLDSVANTNLKIEQIINMPFELFVRIVVFSASHLPYLDLPTKMQTEIIEELFSFTTLTLKAEVLKELIKQTENDLKFAQVGIQAREQEQTRVALQITNARERITKWDTEQKTKIETLETEAARVLKIDVAAQRDIHAVIGELSTQDKETSKEITVIKNQLVLKQKEIEKFKNELEHLADAKCPYCLQGFADAGKKISDIEASLSQAQKEFDDYTGDLATLELLSSKIAWKLANTKKLVVVEKKELDTIQKQQGTIEANLQTAKSAINPHIEALDELLAIKFEKIDYQEINDLTSEIEHQKFLLKLLTKKDSFVRKALLNKNIPFLNARLHHYLQALGLPHKVEFTHELTASISHFGREMDFGNLSAGQRARVNLALSFAFRDVLQSIHSKVNVCLLDEVLDIGLDGVGVQAAARLLKRKAKDEGLSVFIISHRDEIDRAFDRIMTVQMSKGFSQIKDST